MPIRPENRARYPRDWKAMSLQIRRDRAGWRCEMLHDGERCRAVNGEPRTLTLSRVVLTFTVARRNIDA